MRFPSELKEDNGTPLWEQPSPNGYKGKEDGVLLMIGPYRTCQSDYPKDQSYI
jgi:hypothetical protein